MLRTFRPRLLFFFSVSAIATAFLVSACTDEATDTPATDAGTDGPNRNKDSGKGEGEEEEEDDAGGSETDAGDGKDANGPGAVGDECAFNRDCQLALRCECDEGACACQAGARGTGKNGVDTCTSGNDCESSMCVEGPSGSFCSDECEDNADCTGNLPRCFPIVGLPAPVCWFPED